MDRRGRADPAAAGTQGWTVLVLPDYPDPAREAAALDAGAIGIIGESTSLEALLRTVRTAAAEHLTPVRW